jgi:cell division protein DivIC|tara:strand:+ start:3453 stop:3788 length:336 start_codon:yes stop_codon:yes gene_type:complete
VFQKLKKNYFLIISTFLIIYFFFNLLDGERGLISYLKKRDILSNSKIEKFKLEDEIKNLEHKNLLLNEKLDLDYIEILIRDKFMFGKKNEKTFIIEINKNEKYNSTPRKNK